MLRWLGPTLVLMLSVTAGCGAADVGGLAPRDPHPAGMSSAAERVPASLAFVDSNRGIGPGVRSDAELDAGIAGVPGADAAESAARDGGIGAVVVSGASLLRQAAVESEPGCQGEASLVATAAHFADRTTGWAGGDLMERIELPDASVLWIFGDTFVGQVSEAGALADGYRFVHSSAVRQRGTCFEMVETDDGGGWVSWPPDGTWLWPQEAIVDDGLLYVFLVRVQRLPNAAAGLDFEVVGGSIAVFSLTDLSDPLLVIPNSPATDRAPFGWGLLTHDGSQYAYAHIEGSGTFVARVAVGALLDFDAWTYWDGASWVAEADQAAAIHPDRLRVRPGDDGGFDALALPFGSTVVTEYAAVRPEGPFDPVRELSVASVVDPEQSWAYEPMLFESGDDEALMINVMPWDTSQIAGDVSLYGPRFLPVS